MAPIWHRSRQLGISANLGRRSENQTVCVRRPLTRTFCADVDETRQSEGTSEGSRKGREQKVGAIDPKPRDKLVLIFEIVGQQRKKARGTRALGGSGLESVDYSTRVNLIAFPQASVSSSCEPRQQTEYRLPFMLRTPRWQVTNPSDSSCGRAR